MLNRRKFIQGMSVSAAGLVTQNTYAIASNPESNKKNLTFGIISDLHHLQFGQDEVLRLKGFMDAVIKAKPDFIIQGGDFCRATKSDGIMAEWNRFAGPKYHVLGNHDMDYCDKETIMKFWNMPKPYYSFDTGGFHFVVMDRNFLKKEDGTLVDYNKSNWGPLPAPQRSFTEKSQLDWLREDLAKTELPIVVFMHQPVFLSDFFQEIGNANDILQIFDETNLHTKDKKGNNKVVAVFMGHDHDDRHGERNGVHYFIVNSATYVYTKGGAYFYKDPLYAFVTLDSQGKLTIEGRTTTYSKQTPFEVMAKFPTKISDYQVQI